MNDQKIKRLQLQRYYADHDEILHGIATKKGPSLVVPQLLSTYSRWWTAAILAIQCHTKNATRLQCSPDHSDNYNFWLTHFVVVLRSAHFWNTGVNTFCVWRADYLFGKHLNANFSTRDHDKDGLSTRQCGAEFHSGWWFRNIDGECCKTNLNGRYGRQNMAPCAGVQWKFRGRPVPLKSVEMKVRPYFMTRWREVCLCIRRSPATAWTD